MNDASEIKLVPATIEDYPIIQRMWPFYVYGRECGAQNRQSFFNIIEKQYSLFK